MANWHWLGNGIESLDATFIDPCVAVGGLFQSRNPIRALQFATQQSDAQQLLDDDDFLSVALNYDWTDPSQWHKLGDASLTYLPQETSVVINRNVTSPLKTLGVSDGLNHDIPDPVFSFRQEQVPDDSARLSGGIESPLVDVSPHGMVHAAVRLTGITSISNPLLLQIVGQDGTILAEKEIIVRQGEMVETFVSYILGSWQAPFVPIETWTHRTLVEEIPDVVAHPSPLVNSSPQTIILRADEQIQVRLIQLNPSTDTWKVDRLSLFDESLLWEFSVNGGGAWNAAYGIRNDPNGALAFPAAGNALQWRATAYRPLNVSYIEIRPWYRGLLEDRFATHRSGANISQFDQFPPIEEDPSFLAWSKPVPRWWFFNQIF